MPELSEKLKQARENLKLTIEEASSKTKIRSHIIKSFEKGEFSVLPPVYARSSVTAYAQFLKIPQEEIEDDLKEIFKPAAPSQYTNIIKESYARADTRKMPNLAELKQKAGSKSHLIVNYLIYTAIAVTMLTLLYITFFTGDSSRDSMDETADPLAEKADTTVIEYKNKGLLDLFESKNDSLILEATGIDSAWIEINLDGKFKEQALITPNDYKRWAAKDFILLTTGNVGAVEFKRNGEVLPSFGKKGSVIRNIKITHDNVVNPTYGDSLRKQSRSRKKKSPPPLLEPSKIENKSFKPTFKESEDNK